MQPGSKSFRRWTKPPLFLAALGPALYLVAGVFGVAGVSLGANPVEAIMDLAGVWALRFLLIGLAITPLANLTGRRWLIAYRRMIGLFAFFYLSLHLVVYVVLDRTLDVGLILEDVVKRPFITIGLAAFLMLIPLAVTSTKGWMSRLGRRWKSLHRLVYPAAILGVWHYYWQVKLDTLEPLVYAVILAILLGYRVQQKQAKNRRIAGRKARSNSADTLTTR